jgi:hypothetical protein
MEAGSVGKRPRPLECVVFIQHTPRCRGGNMRGSALAARRPTTIESLASIRSRAARSISRSWAARLGEPRVPVAPAQPAHAPQLRPVQHVRAHAPTTVPTNSP